MIACGRDQALELAIQLGGRLGGQETGRAAAQDQRQALTCDAGVKGPGLLRGAAGQALEVRDSSRRAEMPADGGLKPLSERLAGLPGLYARIYRHDCDRMRYTTSMASQHAAVSDTSMTYAEYLAFEEAAEVKHEYLRGTIWPMAGGTLEHGELAVNIAALLKTGLRGKGFKVYNSDVRVRVPSVNFAAYPEVSVVRGQPERPDDDARAIVNPVLIVEVLSDSTEVFDRGDKAKLYQRIPSLREYLLISQHQRRLELKRRHAEDVWHAVEAGAGESIELVSLGLTIRVDDVYEDLLAE